MKKKMKKIIGIIAMSALILTGCAGAPTNQEEKLKVVTTAYALEYFISAIGGEHVEVVFSLEGNPHHFELTQNDAGNIMNADLFLNVDVGDYRAIGQQVMNVKKNLPMTDISKGVSLLKSDHVHSHGEDHEHSDEDEHTHSTEEEHIHNEATHEHSEDEHQDSIEEINVEQMDPHVWLDPLSAKIVVENMTKALTEADPKNKSVYEENAKRLSQKLVALDEEAAAKLENISTRDFLVAHGAYAYLAERYHLQQTSINSNSDHGENTQQSIMELDSYIDEKSINTVFLEKNMEANNVVDILVNQKNLQKSYLYNIETKITETDDYFELMEENINALAQALQ